VAGAFVALRPEDGAVLALVGGYDFYHSKFNRVAQARRQPGSGFKAFIYSAALEAGFTTASLINDAPVVLSDASLEGDWRPENYSGKFFGPTRLRFALTKSRNLVSIRLLRSMGVEHTLAHAQRFGFDPAELPHNLSLALGSGGVTPLQMARGYAVLANGGFLIDPYFVQRIEEDGQGVIFEAAPRRACPECSDLPVVPDITELESNPPPDGLAPRVISPENRYLMYSMMQDVITAGTATKARVLGRQDLAGKTGTTNEQRDAWFNGYNQHLVAVTWVGFDSNAKLGRGEVGGQAALPAWIDFMRVALEGMPEDPPQMPADLVTVRIDPKTGERAPAGLKEAIFEIFRPDEVPAETASAATNAPIGGRRGGEVSAPPVDQLF
jgi:penicillin-binding protein 1A